MSKAIDEAIDLFQSSRVIVVGDIMLDQYLWGSVERISPEAPVPVVSVDKTTCLLGGAGNVARNIKALGGQPWLLSVCGQDRNGQELRDILEQQGISNCLLADKQRQTTLKTRVIAGGQHVVRVDQESLQPVTDEVEEVLCVRLEEAVRQDDIVVVSDYGKGVLTPGLQTCLNGLVQKQGCRILIDPKPANFSLYPEAIIMTPNRKWCASQKRAGNMLGRTETGCGLRIAQPAHYPGGQRHAAFAGPGQDLSYSNHCPAGV